MKHVATKSTKKPGRPLSFDRGAALKQAMLLFWRYGYEATSLAELTAAMGISPPSLYAAFGDKKHLFLEAIEMYVSGGPTTATNIIRSAATARDAVWALISGSAIALTGIDTPAGCMLISAATNCSAAAGDIQAALAKIRLGNEAELRAKIQRDADDGVLPSGTDATALSSLYMAVIQGMSTQARDGAERHKLLAMAEAAMRAWPTPENSVSEPISGR